MKFFSQSFICFIFLFFNHLSLSVSNPLGATFKPSSKNSQASTLSFRKPSSVQPIPKNFKASFAVVVDSKTKEATCIQPLTEAHYVPSFMGVKAPSKVPAGVDLPNCNGNARAWLVSTTSKMVKASPEEVATGAALPRLIMDGAESAMTWLSCTGMAIYGSEAIEEFSFDNKANLVGVAGGTYATSIIVAEGVKEEARYRAMSEERVPLDSQIKEFESRLSEIQNRQKEIMESRSKLKDPRPQLQADIKKLNDYKALAPSDQKVLATEIHDLKNKIYLAKNSHVPNYERTLSQYANELNQNGHEISRIQRQLPDLKLKRQALVDSIETAKAGARRVPVIATVGVPVVCVGVGGVVLYLLEEGVEAVYGAVKNSWKQMFP